MNGKLLVGGIVLSALAAGAVMWWAQLYAYYEEAAFAPGEEIRLTPILSDAPEAIVANEVTGIDSDSSPLRFRACFTTPLSQAMLTETYRVYPDPTPLNAPPWFDCFDAERIDMALQKGEAIAFLSEHDIAPGVDRVVAVFPDGHAFAWHQLNAEEQ
ncbi:histidine kinase [Cereibacter sphaeroides]|uniref:DUF6446 family protein n=1 Tax=Cereibacter sphaeroides TaxID=1063 RepID=UPI000F541CAB|nr:DUF6446 family protein [Cereibacter sphaeroides]AZB56324.1 histidine kinase [Cereibacter sphaeroides]AZB60581.1 histidine kinase [Cereibacter sphaeroides]